MCRLESDKEEKRPTGPDLRQFLGLAIRMANQPNGDGK